MVSNSVTERSTELTPTLDGKIFILIYLPKITKILMILLTKCENDSVDTSISHHPR